MGVTRVVSPAHWQLPGMVAVASVAVDAAAAASDYSDRNGFGQKFSY